MRNLRRDKTLFIIYCLSSVILFLSGCGDSTWSSDQKKSFLNDCDAEGGSDSYCQCYLEKTMEKYPNYADSKNLDFESAVEIAASCQ